MLTADDKSEIILEILQQTFGIEFVREDETGVKRNLGFTSVDDKYRIFVYANMLYNSKEDYIQKVREGFESNKDIIKPNPFKCYVMRNYTQIEEVPENG
ncbi:TPA: hypothetical protein NKP43_004522 [Vibrio parahaemolyticus]|uniref:hypothetical protein n=1 Tax=Vibrio harveyi group TaxID=717610 RepID=UPI000793102A|nr:hypothetical protein [Vibrio alginolyticus]KXZ36274.1 hypothetical protein A0H77_13330 [Vibrio alginolyticus]HCE3381925.1 hypothetical protein [Vibrio parahaemolyticus]HCH0944863.1 hypothetical protein [Vibrio parahaemolyticus]